MNIRFSRILGDRLIKVSTIAKATGISRTTLTALYYKRSSQISFDVLEKLCIFLDCTPSDLLEVERKKDDE